MHMAALDKFAHTNIKEGLQVSNTQDFPLKFSEAQGN